MAVVYNEIAPVPAAWLRELIKAGELPEGEVDEASIVDLAPSAAAATFHAFAGIGGWPLALRLAGWPDNVPVWTGSCPCQPLSNAGLGRGVEDERHLWPAWFRLIVERHPPIVFGEQVASRAGRDWLAAVRADLESVGYAVGAADLPAAGVGAPHVRQRIFFGAVRVAYANEVRRDLSWERGVEDRWSSTVIRGPLSDGTRRPAPSGVPILDDGLPRGLAARAHEGFGNAIVPQVAAAFIRAFVGTVNENAGAWTQMELPATKKASACALRKAIVVGYGTTAIVRLEGDCGVVKGVLAVEHMPPAEDPCLECAHLAACVAACGTFPNGRPNPNGCQIAEGWRAAERLYAESCTQ